MLAIPAACLAVGVAASTAAGHVAKAAGSPTGVSVRKVALGRILVDGSGRTLYLFEKDRGGRSACTGACATAWPPLLTMGHARATGGAAAKMLGTTRRADGRLQVTYAGHPLYRFAGDRRPGQTSGEGSKAFGASWYVLAPNGTKIDRS